jgi:2-oxoglutarate dehydrogenase E2 component (dihydrolipoamide succinyltransferase)
MQPIIVPTINSNDTDAKLLAWTKADGEAVQCGETIAVLETTKATFDLAAEKDGLLHPIAEAGRRCAFGTTIGYVFANAAERAAFRGDAIAPTSKATASDDVIITKAARELVARHHISDEKIRALGRRIVKAKDLEALIPEVPAGEFLALSVQQQSIARVVSRSRATIPDSFLVKKIGVDAALDALAQFSRAEKVMAGLPDLLVWSIARLPEVFPFFFGTLGDGLRFRPSKAGNIGVTFDLGRGLFIPVVKGAAGLSLREIARTMMGFRMKALRAGFHAEELGGGDLTLSLNMDADVLLVQPIILPPQTCMLSLSAVLKELVLDATGRPVERRSIQLGVAFDHRVINGFEANALANAIKARLESGDLSGAGT